jgi:hypothetical protein
VNGYLKNPIGDGGKAHIPLLKVIKANSFPWEVNSNEDKAKAKATTFFLPKPTESSVPLHYEYPSPLPTPLPITEEHILACIQKLSLYKAPRPDGIPNIVLQNTAALIASHLLQIYCAILTHSYYFKSWQEFTTCVLRKPGKP